ncbi:MAG: creatininase family protein [Haloferacaceae archaeon]
MTTEREMERLTDPDVEAYLDAADVPTALVPVGTTEQHGPHLSLSTDALIPAEVCRRVAPEVDALVAPRINYGFSDDHVGFSGVAYLRQETLVDVLADVAYSLCESGFEDVVFVNGHYTNEAPIKVACNRVMRDLPADKHVYGFPYWMAMDPEDAHDYLSFEAGWHANVGETSAVLAIDEDLVDMDAAVSEFPDFPTDAPNPVALMDPTFAGPGTMYRVLESGVWGDATEATAAKGEAYFEVITEAVAELIQTFQRERDDLFLRDRPEGDDLF